MSIFDKIKETGKEFISQTKEQITESPWITSISEKMEKLSEDNDYYKQEIDKLNNNLNKLSKDSDYYKQEISKITNVIPKEININKELEYFKKSIKALKIIFTIIAVLLLMLIIVLILK